MLTKIKYVDHEGKEKIIDVQIFCKPNIEDYLFVDGIGTLMVTRVMVVCRQPNDRNMKRPVLMITAQKGGK